MQQNNFRLVKSGIKHVRKNLVYKHSSPCFKKSRFKMGFVLMQNDFRLLKSIIKASTENVVYKLRFKISSLANSQPCL